MDSYAEFNKNNIEEILSLTALQEGMLFHHISHPQGDDYFCQLSIRVSGEIKIDILKKTWEYLIEENEMLRCVFRWEKLSKPVQIILKKHKLNLSEYDFSEMDLKSNEMALRNLKYEDRKKGFDLRQVPFRVSICKIEETIFEMIISFHHILFDGWSSSILISELIGSYNSILRGIEPQKRIKSKFKEFIKWHHAQKSSSHKEFWTRYLKGFDNKTLLSDGRNTSGIVETMSYILPEKLSCEICQFAREKEITQAVLFYSALGILLQRYNNTEDVLFGTTVSGRTPDINGINNAIGLFINTVPIRIKTEPNETIGELLEKVNIILKERAEHENTPLRAIKLYSDLDKNETLFDCIVVIENYPLFKELKNLSAGISINTYSIWEKTNFDLTISITYREQLELNLAYKSEIIKQDKINSLARHYEKLLEQMIQYPEKNICEIEFLTDNEKNRILFDFNNTEAHYPKNKLIYQLFEEQAEYMQDKTACIFKNRIISYRELNSKSNQLARFLRFHGAKPGSIIGIACERSPEMIIGVFGILKAGGAYLPIDPGYPADRVNFMLEDSNALMVLTSRTSKNKLKCCCKIVDIDDLKIYRGDGSNTGIINTSNDLAYVIYTSGSTGKPKGVMIEHHSVINRLKWMQKKYPLGERDIILQKTPFTFDVSVWELFWWALEGASVKFLEPGEEKDPKAIVNAIDETGITTVHFVPSMFNIFLNYLRDSGQSGKVRSLKYVFTSGEELKAQSAADFYNLLSGNSGVQLTNLYGPTEATVDVSYYNCHCGCIPDNIPIGKPIDNIALYS
jgi:amino acid adenylation domain-containing protein